MQQRRHNRDRPLLVAGKLDLVRHGLVQQREQTVRRYVGGITRRGLLFLLRKKELFPVQTTRLKKGRKLSHKRLSAWLNTLPHPEGRGIRDTLGRE